MDLLSEDIPEFLTVNRFRQLTGIGRSLAYELIRSGDLRSVRLGKRGAIRVPREELRRFLESRSLTRDAA